MELGESGSAENFLRLLYPIIGVSVLETKCIYVTHTNGTCNSNVCTPNVNSSLDKPSELKEGHCSRRTDHYLINQLQREKAAFLVLK